MTDVPAKPNVVSLREGTIQQPGEPRPNVVAELERALEMARSGEIDGLAAVYHHTDECTTSIVLGSGYTRAALGQLSLVQFQICQRLDEDR